MDAARWKLVRALFEELVELSSEQRASILAERCEGDEELRSQVELLLAEDATTGQLSELIERLPVHKVGQTPASSAMLERLTGRGSDANRFRLEGEIARGGMGAVLRVWDEDLRRHLAMKVMLDQEPSSDQGAASPADPATLARFLEEAQVTGQLDHPGIVPVHELGLDAEGRVYFTMKLVKGRTLDEVFGGLACGAGGWSQTRVLGLLLKVCEAMSYAHAKGVIHRDLKPANVMVGSYGEVFVMDWGLAKVLDQPDEKDVRVREGPGAAVGEARGDAQETLGGTPDLSLVTMQGEVLGTPAYMSPEQALGQVDEMGPPADVYALGAMLYQLLAGHRPYVPPGSSTNNLAVWSRVMEGPPRPLREVAPDATAELVAICEKAMQREASRRYPDMSALAEDLAAYLEGRVVRAYETGAWAEARKWVQRNKPLAAALMVALLGLVAGLASSLILKSRADANAQTAERQRGRAEQNELLARAETAKVLRLSDVKRLQRLELEANALWPPYPDAIEPLETWLERAAALLSNLPVHLETIATMRRSALPWARDERRSDRATHPRTRDLLRKQAEMDGLIATLEQGLDGQALVEAEERVVRLEAEVVELTEAVEARRTWSFDSAEEQWQHDVLQELIAGLEVLQSGLMAADPSGEVFGWSVPRRLAFARSLAAGFTEDGDHARAWAEALPAIHEAYPDLELAPQIGLLPLGPDPDSGLWEFAHLMTGVPPERDSGGRLVLSEQSGVVLVLLPGGSFWMGAQSNDPSGHHYDPRAIADQAPVHEVELSAFLLSKYELTQGQWTRLTGRNPSAYGPDVRWDSQWLSSATQSSLRHPVEQVSWLDCMEWLPRAGLALPSEAQWEYGARGGTQTPWWSGAEQESLRGVANLADAYAGTHGGEDWMVHEPWLDDGATVHAPAGSFTANPFGLHDVTGNVWELCLDGYDWRFYRSSPRLDPVAPWADAVDRVCRGGGFRSVAEHASVSYRSPPTPSNVGDNLGVRPAARVVTR